MQTGEQETLLITTTGNAGQQTINFSKIGDLEPNLHEKVVCDTDIKYHNYNLRQTRVWYCKELYWSAVTSHSFLQFVHVRLKVIGLARLRHLHSNESEYEENRVQE